MTCRQPPEYRKEGNGTRHKETGERENERQRLNGKGAEAMAGGRGQEKLERDGKRARERESASCPSGKGRDLDQQGRRKIDRGQASAAEEGGAHGVVVYT